MQKESPRTRGFEGCYSRYFAGGFALRRCRNSIRRYSAAPEREFRSQFPLFPLDGFSSAVPSLQLHPVFSAVSNRVLPSNTMSCFIAFRDKSLDNLKNFFQTQGFEFLFLSQRAQRGAIGGSIALKTPVLKLNRPLACKPPATIVGELERAVFVSSSKTAGHRSSPSAGKGSSLRWLAYELTSRLWDSADVRKRFELP